MRLLPTSALRERSAQRGFTLIELMVVVVIIAILAVIAVPSFARRFDERRLQQTALRVAAVYRIARARALGRGAAILVRKAGDTFTVLEGVEGTTTATNEGDAQCANLPTRGCLSNTWVVGSGSTIGTARQIDTLTISGTVPSATTGGSTAGGVSGENYDICFSPAGRTWVGSQPSTFKPMSGALSIKVANSRRNFDVVILPNGMARLGL